MLALWMDVQGTCSGYNVVVLTSFVVCVCGLWSMVQSVNQFILWARWRPFRPF